ATVCVTAQPASFTQVEWIPIGKPLPGSEVYILDAYGEPVPAGVPGEIYIGGQQLARGYLNRAELTAEKFIPNPFSSNPASRLYRTGDLAKWRISGEIEYLGRNDFQVKIRGFRIELGEIESKLLNCNAVLEAVVVAREEGGDKHLVAYYVEEAGANLKRQDLKQKLANELADYMVPSIYVKLESMPITANGKLDRRALPIPSDLDFVKAEFMPPEGEIEIALALIWQRLLNVELIGRSDNFFEIGGHSLLAAKLMNAIKQQFNLVMPLRLIFEHPTIAEFAQVMSTLIRHTSDEVGESEMEMEQGDL
ncbi:MAG TPA: phosphopantetheine-binding protein, partial [Pseudomonadales bacterium]|nr:phosphopantetheine-binding protein [Pseudomonadales bacterium]